MTARRGKGEGAISLRKDGRWEARITLEPLSEKRRRRAFYGTTRTEVAKKLRLAQAKVDANIPLPPENLTLESHLLTWLETKRSKVRPDTLRRYRDLCQHIIAIVGARKL